MGEPKYPTPEYWRRDLARTHPNLDRRLLGDVELAMAEQIEREADGAVFDFDPPEPA